MKYLSLFAGVGGFELGIEQACDALHHRAESAGRDTEDGDRSDSRGQPKRQAVPVPRCIGFSEIDKYALAIYRKHFPDHTDHGDITAIDPATLPDVDLICGGCPCQAFSIAGKRRGFEDTRGTLFFEILRLAEAKRPRLVLLENVKGLLSHDGGRTFYTIISALDELGYDCQWQLLNGADWVPQNRERIVIVGHLRGIPPPEVFPLRRGDAPDTPRGNLAPTLKARADSGIDKKHPQTLIAHTLDANYSKGPNNRGQRSYIQTIPHGYNTGWTKELPNLRAHGGATHNEILMPQIRRLTPVECERLMGLPDGWTQYGIDEHGDAIAISDTQRYKCLGNGIIPQMVRDVVVPLLDAHSSR